MYRRHIHLVTILLALLVVLAACGGPNPSSDKTEPVADVNDSEQPTKDDDLDSEEAREPEEVLEETSEAEETISYGLISFDGDGNYQLSEFKLILENDAAAAEEFGLLDEAFDFTLGYARYNQKRGFQINFEPFEVDKSTRYYLFDHPQDLEHQEEVFSDGSYSLIEIDEDAFRELLKEIYPGFYKVKVFTKEDRVVKIEELDEIAIARFLYSQPDTGIINNGGSFVKYDDDIYYRQYASFAFEPTSLGGVALPSLDGTSLLIKMGPDGKSEFLFAEYGSGGFFIYEDETGEPSFISQDWVSTGPEGEELPGGRHRVYRRNIEGGLLTEYEGIEALSISKAKGLVITEGEDGEVKVIDIADGQPRFSFKGQFIYHDLKDDMVYFQDASAYDEAHPLNISSGDLATGETRLILRLSREEMEEFLYLDSPLSGMGIENFRASGDFVWLALGGYTPMSEVYDDTAFLKIRKDGSGYTYKLAAQSVDWLGVDRPFNEHHDGPFSLAKPSYAVHPSYNPFTRIQLLGEEDLEELGYYNWADLVGTDNEYVELVERVELVDENLFFTVVELERNEEESFGNWPAFNRTRTKVYWKNFAEGKTSLLYTE
ncbi:MAG: hypothetical protein GX079_00685 [Tissierellia bacterium]|nr:hypothetical protein [Tissierellia bacterium]